MVGCELGGGYSCSVPGRAPSVGMGCLEELGRRCIPVGGVSSTVEHVKALNSEQPLENPEMPWPPLFIKLVGFVGLSLSRACTLSAFVLCLR